MQKKKCMNTSPSLEFKQKSIQDHDEISFYIHYDGRNEDVRKQTKARMWSHGNW